MPSVNKRIHQSQNLDRGRSELILITCSGISSNPGIKRIDGSQSSQLHQSGLKSCSFLEHVIQGPQAEESQAARPQVMSPIVKSSTGRLNATPAPANNRRARHATDACFGTQTTLQALSSTVRQRARPHPCKCVSLLFPWQTDRG